MYMDTYIYVCIYIFIRRVTDKFQSPEIGIRQKSFKVLFFKIISLLSTHLLHRWRCVWKRNPRPAPRYAAATSMTSSVSSSRSGCTTPTIPELFQVPEKEGVGRCEACQLMRDGLDAKLTNFCPRRQQGRRFDPMESTLWLAFLASLIFSSKRISWSALMAWSLWTQSTSNAPRASQKTDVVSHSADAVTSVFFGSGKRHASTAWSQDIYVGLRTPW